MQKRSVLFVGGQIDIGGAGKMLKYAANSVCDQFEVSVLSYIQVNRPKDLAENITFYNTGLSNHYSLFQRLIIMHNIRKMIDRIAPDLICAFTSEVSVMARIATLGQNTHFVSAERGDPYTLPFIWKMLARFAYKNSDACIFQLPKARDFFGKGVAKKSYVIPNPFILPQDVSPYYGDRNKTIVSAGRFQPEKGFNILIDAYARIVNRHPEYKLVIFGEGPLLEDYKKQIEEYGISENVSFPGYVPNVAESVRQEGIFVLSSLLEGIPNVLIEAMSVGIPIVTTDCSPGGPAFLTGEGQRGLVVPMNNSEAMANAIIQLIENDNLYKQMEEEGPKIREILDQKVISEKWINAFTEILM